MTESSPSTTKKLENQWVEDQVLTLSPLKAIKEPVLFKRFLEQVALKLVLPNSSFEIIKAFANIDVTSDKVAQLLRSNPYYEFQFYRMLESKGVKLDEKPTLESAVVLLGMQNSRNLIVSLQVLRLINGGHPEWDKEGKLKISPTEILKYALRTEEILTRKNNSYADLGFAAGLLFDLLTLIANQRGVDKNKITSFIENIYAHGLKAALIATELSRFMTDMSYSKYVFGATLIHDVGKIILGILEPDYLSFLESVRKKELPREVRHFAEEKRYGVNHALLGGVACHYFKIFKAIEKAILFHHEPFLVKGLKRNIYNLTALICLSTKIASHPKKAENLKDPVLKLWKGPDLQDFKIDARSLVALGSKIMSF
jgi:HD-like signal output (HDOD) protein